MKRCFFTLMALAAAASVAAGEAAPDAFEKTAYAGQVGSQDEFDRIVTAKGRELEIQGGFVPQGSKDPYARWAKRLWVETQSYSVGDTIEMEFHIGVVGTLFKLNTKSFPAPQPVLQLMENSKEIKQVKFTKGAC